MTVLVAYASKHDATQEIANRIAEKIQSSGLTVEVKPVKSVNAPENYQAFVIGSAVYMGHWQKEATEFVRQNKTTLAQKPVWLFSSGPLGEEGKDAQGRDKRQSAIPVEIAELSEAIKPKDHHVFFGALRHNKLGLSERLIGMLPAGKDLLPEGDFRNWPEIESWAQDIARKLAQS